MANSEHTYEQLRNMADSGASMKDTVGLMAAVVSDIAENQKNNNENFSKVLAEHDIKLKQVDTNKEEIATLRKENKIIGGLSAIFIGIGTWLGLTK